MTMLDRMRRHKNWLKWSLAIVVVAFVLLYIPNFLRNGIGGSVATGTRDVIASVEGQTITVGQFRRIYQQQMQAYRELPDDQLFRVERVEVAVDPAELPGYKAERVVCARCGEGVNFGRFEEVNGERLCLSCAGPERRYWTSKSI